MIWSIECLAPLIVLSTPLTELDFKSLALMDSFTWKRIEQVMNEYRSKLGSNTILEFKIKSVL